MDYKETIDRFTGIAREYCKWFEGSPLAASQEHFTATSLVSALYATAIALPEVDEAYLPDSFENTEASTDPVRLKPERFSEFPFRYYWQIFQPNTAASEVPLCGDIIDDLSDIYLDVKRGLLALDSISEPAAVFLWRFSWSSHWGRHATSALHALHMFDPDDLDSGL